VTVAYRFSPAQPVQLSLDGGNWQSLKVVPGFSPGRVTLGGSAQGSCGYFGQIGEVLAFG
jgi:hypothetical protein